MKKMKRVLAVLIIAAMSVGMGGCGEYSDLIKKNEELASEVDELKSLYEEQARQIEELTEEDEEYPEEETASDAHEEVGTTESALTNAEKTVWVGKTGTKYHKENCRTLRETKREITLEEALRQGREACNVCGG